MEFRTGRGGTPDKKGSDHVWGVPLTLVPRTLVWRGGGPRDLQASIFLFPSSTPSVRRDRPFFSFSYSPEKFTKLRGETFVPDRTVRLFRLFHRSPVVRTPVFGSTVVVGPPKVPVKREE